ncbi:MAG: hypothetical protein K0U37_07945 [Gammaproteobacteria bacterium]|nr:hypothetical protein [Gammaproteobacteria bacterium]
MALQTRYQADVARLSADISAFEAKINELYENIRSYFTEEEFNELIQKRKSAYQVKLTEIELQNAALELGLQFKELNEKVKHIQSLTGFDKVWEDICNLFSNLFGYQTRLEATQAQKTQTEQQKERAEILLPHFRDIASLTREKLPIDLELGHTLKAQTDFMSRKSAILTELTPLTSATTGEKGKHFFGDMKNAIGNIGAKNKTTRTIDPNEQLNLVARALKDFLSNPTEKALENLKNTLTTHAEYTKADRADDFCTLLDEANDAYFILPDQSQLYRNRIRNIGEEAENIALAKELEEEYGTTDGEEEEEEEEDHGQYGRYGRDRLNHK